MPFVVAPEVPACPGVWLWAPGRGNQRRRGRRSGRRSPALDPEADGGFRDAAGAGPRCRSRGELWALVPPHPDPEAGAGRRCAEATGAGTGTVKRAARPPRCWIGLVKSLKKIYMCVVSSAEGLNLYSFSAPSAP